MMNKKGSILMRDMMFLIIIFGGILALSSIFVLDMAQEYSNTNATTEFNELGIGDVEHTLLAETNDSQSSIRDDVEGSSEKSGVITTLFSTVSGIASMFKTILAAPIFMGNAFSSLVDGIGVPKQISDIGGTMLMLAIYFIIIMGIITAALRGSKV